MLNSATIYSSVGTALVLSGNSVTIASDDVSDIAIELICISELDSNI